MTLGAPVVIVLKESCFCGRRGVVASLRPFKVLLDGEEIPLLFAERDVVPASTPQHMVAGE